MRCQLPGIGFGSAECRRMISNDRDRRYWLYNPHVESEKNTDLIIELHGSGLSAIQQMCTSRLYESARKLGFIIVAPEALVPLRLFDEFPEGTAWYLPGIPFVGQKHPDETGPNEQVFLIEILEDLRKSLKFFPERIYLVGYSGGARLASRLMHTMPNTFAGVAAVSGLRYPGVPPRGPLPPVIAFHGVLDPINPFFGSADLRWHESVLTTIDVLARLRGAQVKLQVEDNLSATETMTYKDPSDRTVLVQHLLKKGGHGWPGSLDPEHQQMFGRTSADLDATALILQYFSYLKKT